MLDDFIGLGFNWLIADKYKDNFYMDQDFMG